MHKPVEGKIRMENTNILISPSAFCVEDDYVWIIDASVSVFYKYNRKNGDNDCYRIKQDVLNEQESQYLGIHVFNNKLFFVPCWEKEIVVVNTLSMERRIIEEENRNSGRFIKSFVIGKYLYCIPFYEEFFIKIDMETEEIIKKIEWKKIYPTAKYINSACMYDNAIYCVAPDITDTIIKFENDLISYIKTNTYGVSFTSIAFCVDTLYIYAKNEGVVYEYNEESKQLKFFESGFKDFVVLQSIKNKILLIENGITGELAYLDIEHGKLYKKNIRRKIGTNRYVQGLIYALGEFDYYYDRRENVLYEINNSMEKTKILPNVNRKKVRQIVGVRVEKESAFYNLEDFLNDI